MSYANLIRRASEQNVLFSVLVELTYACNLNCFYCYNDRSQIGKPLTTDQYFRFFEDLRDMGVLNLILSGGEPLIHPDFYILGAKARELGFVIRIKSNGHVLNGDTIQQIRQQIDPFCIDISLHGATAAVHDRQTRVAGSFDCLMKNLQVLRAYGQRFRLNVTLTAWNEDELEQMFSLADSFATSLTISTALTPRDDGDLEPLSIVPSLSALKRLKYLLQVQAEKNEANGEVLQEQTEDCQSTEVAGKHCGIGSSILAVDPFGKVMPCVQWRNANDSLHSHRIHDIWNQSGLFEYTRKIAAAFSSLPEGKGKAEGVIGLCPALAHCFEGKSTESDKYLSYLLKVAEHEKE